MGAHVLLVLLMELGKRDKMRGLPRISSLFRIEFNNFNNTEARMFDSIYHMTLKFYTLKITFRRENIKIVPSFTQRYNGHHYVTLLNL